MRTETDTFRDDFDGNRIRAEVDRDDEICINVGFSYIWLSKENARELFKQGLEMCGEPEAAEQPDFNFVKESE